MSVDRQVHQYDPGQVTAHTVVMTLDSCTVACTVV